MSRIVALLAGAASLVAAPTPGQLPHPTVVSVRQAIGKNHLGKEVRAVGRQVGEDPVIHYALWTQEVPENTEETHFYLQWKSKGLELCFSRSHLHTARMYNTGVAGYKRYVGELPDGLSFDDDLAAVEKKLGKPDLTLKAPDEGKPAEEGVDTIYKEKGVCVSFRRRAAGGRAVVTSIALFPRGDAPCW